MNRNADSQPKFGDMQCVLPKSPKAIFFLRVFFNVVLKLIDYAEFRPFQKCWEKLLEVSFAATKNILKERDQSVDVACILIAVLFHLLMSYNISQT